MSDRKGRDLRGAFGIRRSAPSGPTWVVVRQRRMTCCFARGWMSDRKGLDLRGMCRTVKAATYGEVLGLRAAIYGAGFFSSPGRMPLSQ